MASKWASVTTLLGSIRSPWSSIQRVYRDAPKLLRRVLFTLLLILAATTIADVAFVGPASRSETGDILDIVRSARLRTASITRDLDTARDLLVDDYRIQQLLGASTVDQKFIFGALDRIDSIWSFRAPDTAGTRVAQDWSRITARGLAIYGADRKLIAWESTRPATFGYDTILSSKYSLDTKDRSIRTFDGPIYVSLNDVRKILDRSGQIIGFAVASHLLATKGQTFSGGLITYLDDLRSRRVHEVDFAFGASALRQNSDLNWTRSTLFANAADPSSVIGRLSISKGRIARTSDWERSLLIVRAVAACMLVLLLAGWSMVRIATIPKSGRPLTKRIERSILALMVFSLFRLILVWIDPASVLGDTQLLGAREFASNWGFGIVRNPLELFITALLGSVAAVVLWIIWMPRERLVREDSHHPNIDETVRRERPALIGLAIVAIVVFQVLTNLLVLSIDLIVADSSVRFLSVRQVLPSAPVLMIYLSFLSIGVTYIFLTALLLTFAERAVVFMLPRKMGISRRILLGGFIFLVLQVLGSILWSALDEASIDPNYRWIISVAMFLVSSSVIYVDATAKQVNLQGPSFLYRLPRSSRSILFLLAAATLIVSPLIASEQLGMDKEIAQRLVSSNMEVDGPALNTGAFHVLTTSEQTIGELLNSEDSTERMQQSAFLIWVSSLNDHPDWNAIISVLDGDGKVVSQFGTVGAYEEGVRLAPLRDSVLRDLTTPGKFDSIASGSHISFRTIPCFSGSCTPAVIAALGNGSINSGSHRVSIALWGELPALHPSTNSFNLFVDQSDQLSDYDFVNQEGYVVAEYRPGRRRMTNTTALDVPAGIPPIYKQMLRSRQSFWRESTLNGEEYQTLFYRVSPAAIKDPSIVTVSVPVPTFTRTSEFILRLNAIGLLYGAVIVLVLLVLRRATSRKVWFTLRFRDRIFLIVLLIALVPLIVVTNVTRSLLSERAHVEQQDRLARDASVIQERVARQMEAGGLKSAEIRDIAQIIGRDFSVYDRHGFIRASSRPELYESGLLSSTLSPSALEQVSFGGKSFYAEQADIGMQTYEVGYEPILSAGQNYFYGTISLTTLQEQSKIEAQIARTTSFIYGTFAALGLILLGIGALFAARVASPIITLIHATQRVAQGKLRTSIRVDREDEIGELMHAFNAMTNELEKSREIVAQTERELAWKEMARQVAHEIKNPLTPMKLSVQHLEHAHEAKDPNFNSIFRRVIKTLGEQIEVLTRIAVEFARFGEMPQRKFGAVHLKKVAESAVALFDAERHRIRFIVDVPKDISDIHADEEEFRRALVNLIRNAIQAMQGWGVIVLRARQEKGMIHFRISDTGSGMNDETLKRAFDPNFSTKTSGMGLGLAIVKKTIVDMSGSITVDSVIGRGTTFLIDLPARDYVDPDEEDL